MDRPKAVWKYPIRVNDEVDLRLPEGAQILSVAFQENELALWALVPTDLPESATEVKRLAIRGTGHDATGLEGARFLGTAHHRTLPLVFHVWERTI